MDVVVRWRPYQLNPGAPEAGESKREMYHRKFGAQRVAAMVPMMTQRFAEVGVAYSLGGLTGQTMDSHRLSAHALKVGGEAVQNALMEELFLNYFSQEKYIGDSAVLAAAAEKVGLEGAAAVIADKGVMRAEVEGELRSFARGVRGVPHFVIDGQHHLSGAQPTEAFVEIFEELSSGN